jgi:hypothetical protein
MWELRDAFDWSWSKKSLASAFAPRKRMYRALSLLMPVIGDPIQAFYAFKQWKSINLIYAADQQSATGLLLLRKLRVIRKPIVVVLHNGPRLRWTWWMLRSADRVISISPATHRMVKHRLPGVESEHLTWGPSLSSPVYTSSIQSTKDLDFFAAGKSNRDYADLRGVAVHHRLSGIILTGAQVEYFSEGHSRTELRPNFTYKEIIQHLSRANWCVVPLADKSRLSGLTEAADALAAGTSVLCNSKIALPYPLGAVQFYSSAEELANFLTGDSASLPSTESYLQKVSMREYAKRLNEILRSLS